MNPGKIWAKSKKTGQLLAASLLFITVLGNTWVAAQTTAPGPRVSFTFDDGLASALTQAAPALAAYGFTGTEYVTSGCIGSSGTCRADDQATYMTWEQVNQLKNMGWEIGAHTVSHPLLATSDPEDQPAVLTPAEVIAELTDSRNAIASNVGVTPTAFASPYGDWTPTVLAEIAKVYSSHRGFADSIDQNADGVIEHGNGFPYNDYLLYDLPVQNGVSVAQVQSYIDQSIANNQWLILTFHDIKPAGTALGDYGYSRTDLEAIAAYIKSKNIPVVNVTNGLAGGTNLLSGGSFSDGISDGWTADAPATITPDSENNGSYPDATNSTHLTSGTEVGHLFSPQISIDPAQKYFVKSFLNVNAITVAAGNEVAFIIDEYDASGNYLSFQYRKAETSVWLSNLNFEYTPTNANVKSARLQVVVTANSGINAYLANVGWFAQTGGLGGGTTGTTGDLNNSGHVDITDLSILLSNWGQSGVLGNLDGNPTININDLSILLANWG